VDEDAERDPESPGEIAERREFVSELDKEFRERRRELEEKAAADPWDYWPETHDDRYNEADYEVPPLWERLDSNARQIRRRMEREGISNPLAATIGKTRLFPHYWSPGDNDDLTQKLDGADATRVYLYLDLSPHRRVPNRRPAQDRGHPERAGHRGQGEPVYAESDARSDGRAGAHILRQ
jgi:hypothetical protein